MRDFVPLLLVGGLLYVLLRGSERSQSKGGTVTECDPLQPTTAAQVVTTYTVQTTDVAALQEAAARWGLQLGGTFTPSGDSATFVDVTAPTAGWERALRCVPGVLSVEVPAHFGG